MDKILRLARFPRTDLLRNMARIFTMQGLGTGLQACNTSRAEPLMWRFRGVALASSRMEGRMYLHNHKFNEYQKPCFLLRLLSESSSYRRHHPIEHSATITFDNSHVQIPHQRLPCPSQVTQHGKVHQGTSFDSQTPTSAPLSFEAPLPR